MKWAGAVVGRLSTYLRRPVPTGAPLFLVAALLVLGSVACDVAPAVPDAPDIPAIPRIDLGNGPTAKPIPSPVMSTAPPASPSPTGTSTSRPIPTTTSGGDVIQVPRLVIAEIPVDIPGYSRDDWKHWVDVDRDCQDTRAEVLIQESTTVPAFNTDRNCRVIGGSWDGPYTGQTFTEASDVDIDHLVPLKNAHVSGAWQWDEARKEDYANSIATDFHLIAVDKSSNRAKGAKGPEEWQPPDETYRCQYAQDWIAVKDAWGLTATVNEWEALQGMLGQCSGAVKLMDGAGTIALLPTEQPVPAPTGVPSPTAPTGPLLITEIMADPAAVRDTAGEWFEVYNADAELAVNLENWTIRRANGDEHRILSRVVVLPEGYVVLARNGDESANGGIAAVYEYQGINLTNDEDSIELVDSSGQLVDRVAYNADLVFPGASTSLEPTALNADANDNPDNWCRASSAMDNGDFGTPGEENDPC